MKRARFEESKALACILLVADELQKRSPEKKADLYKLLKVIYFADRKHLARHHRSISGDHYVAMNNGPVPSKTYDMLKSIRGDGFYLSSQDFLDHIRKSIRFLDHITVAPGTEPDLDELSDTDTECLNESIEQYKNYTFAQLKNESHDDAFKRADIDDCMDFEHIALAGGASGIMLDYVRSWLENENFFSVR